ncbi:MAG: DUF177 domain-containing protein [Rhodospirillales bacterium]|nr:DUF177 domain-containing protein [Rhodospirillales bacterium]
MAETVDHANVIIPEWSYLLPVEDVGEAEVRLTISPDAEARKNMARRLNLLEVSDLVAKLKVKRRDKRVIKVGGTFKARVVQECIATLKPVPDQIEETLEGWFADPQQAVSFARARHERDKMKSDHEFPVLEEAEDPEPVIDGKIDLGELVTQYLSLSLNPFPRSEEVSGLEASGESDSAPRRENPFAALKALKDEG